MIFNTVFTAAISLLPLIFALLAFFVTLFFLMRGTAIEKLRGLIAIFLEKPATLKTWGLVAAGPMLCLLFNTIVIKISDNASWPTTEPIALARLQILGWFGYLLLCLISIVLGALGAVTFKGQGPGGVSFQLNQDPSGTVSGSASAPAPSPDKPAGT